MPRKPVDALEELMQIHRFMELISRWASIFIVLGLLFLLIVLVWSSQ
jgi:hypothetical protein